ACIYQKQEPVDIPQIETRTLKDVLALPWGFEIYSLLTRWNPLDLRRPIPRPATGRTVLVVGLGPAGVRLAHHLMKDAHGVEGFGHVAVRAGGGTPTALDLAHGLARRVREASDFRMAVQLTGAAKKDRVDNVRIRVPVVALRGGLTAIDTATESLAYYALQVK